MLKTNKNYAYFILPGFVLYTLFVVFPIICVLFLGFTDWSGLGEMHLVGLKNYRTIFADSRFFPVFFNAVGNNLKYLICVWFIITPLQYVIAYALYMRIPCRNYLRFMLFLPYVISTTIVSFFAMLIFNPIFGFLNEFLTKVGLETGSWFGDPAWAFKLLILLVFWQGSGTGIMIFYSNFLDMPKEVLEASRIDGCTEKQKFFRIILPLSLPSCASIITMDTIWALAIFDLPYILGGSNGGVNGCLDFVNTVFYRYTFGSALNGKSDLGFGSSICVVMFLLMLVLSFIQNRILTRFDYNR